MIEAFLNTFKELFRPFFWVIIILNLFITITFFAILVWGSGELVKYYIADYDWLASVAGAGAFFISYMLFPVIFPIFSYLFQDFITSRLSKKYNPKGENITIPVVSVITFAVKFALLSITLNLLFFPLYFIPVLGAVIYYCLNSFLLGREYYQLTAYSLLKKDILQKFRKENSKLIFAAGMIISLMFLTPVINLVAPIIAVIFTWFYLRKLTREKGY